MNCTTINAGSQSGHAALLEVAEKYLMRRLGTQESDEAPPPPSLLNPCTPTHFRSPFASTPALSHNFYALISDPQESGPDLRHHALVSGHIFPEDAIWNFERHNYVTPTNYLELVSGYKKYDGRVRGTEGA